MQHCGHNTYMYIVYLLHFVAFFQVASLLSIGVDNEKVGVKTKKMGANNKKAQQMDNSAVFHRGRKQKSSRAG